MIINYTEWERWLLYEVTSGTLPVLQVEEGKLHSCLEAAQEILGVCMCTSYAALCSTIHST